MPKLPVGPVGPTSRLSGTFNGAAGSTVDVPGGSELGRGPTPLAPLARLALGLLTALGCLGAIGEAPAWGDIRLAKLFGDSMVLQREAEANLHGVADPDEALVLSITGKDLEPRELKTVCNALGEFSLKFAPPPVGGPYELTLTGAKSKVVIRDVMVGDVWLCAGQSNMAWSISKAATAEAAATANERRGLRFITVPNTASPQPLKEIAGGATWARSSAESAAEFSAVAWHFGAHLEQDLQVPIGLIHTSWGGTRAEAWVSPTALAAEPRLAPLLTNSELVGEAAKPQDRLSSLYNGMIAPVQSFPIKGVIWYQGEANVGRGDQYRTLLPTLIADWRQQWKTPHLPFLIVQLAPFRYKNQPPHSLAEVWDAQRETYRRVPYTGLVVTTDLGNFEDVHPLQKQAVGQRLAHWALGEVYRGQALLPIDRQPAATAESPTEAPAAATATAAAQAAANPIDATSGSAAGPAAHPAAKLYSGPLFQAATVEGGRIAIDFLAADGLRSADDQPLREFLVAGADQVFHPAEAEILDGRVWVSSAAVAQPVAVRFCWNDTPKPNLVNAAGLPASPFRSDDLPLSSSGKDY